MMDGAVGIYLCMRQCEVVEVPQFIRSSSDVHPMAQTGPNPRTIDITTRQAQLRPGLYFVFSY